MDADVVAFIPLSNWLRGFERYGMCYSKALIAQSRFPDAFYVLREGEPFAPGLEKSRRLARVRPTARSVSRRPACLTSSVSNWRRWSISSLRRSCSSW